LRSGFNRKGCRVMLSAQRDFFIGSKKRITLKSWG
jgi:hypothetical protein